MTTEISSNSSFPGSAIPVTTESTALHLRKERLNSSTDAEQSERCRPNRSPLFFPDSADDAEQNLLDQLDTVGTVHAAVRFSRLVASIDDPQPTNPCEEDPPFDRIMRSSGDPNIAQQQCRKLLGICTQAADSGKICHHQQLLPTQAILGFPVCLHRGSQQVIAIIMETNDHLAVSLPLVESIVSKYATALSMLEAEECRAHAEHAAAALELATRSLQCNSRSEIAQCIVSRLASHLELKRVGLGYRSKPRSRCRLLGLSDSSQIAPSAAQTRLIENAMDESILFGETVLISPSNSNESVGKAVDELARHEGESIIVVPLIDQQFDSAAALVCVCEPKPDQNTTSVFLSAVAPTLTSLFLARQTHPINRLGDRARRFIRSRSGALWVTALTLLTAAMATPVTHRETCTVTIEPSAKRYIAAPFDAALNECFVTPGDIVHRGDVLAALDGRELRWKREGLQADHHQAVKKRDAAQASHAYAEQRIAQLDIDRIQSELKLLDHRLGELEIRSPVDGVIVSGNLERVQGAPVKLGQTLFEVAPLENMIAECSIPDEIIGFVESGQQGTLRLNAYPRETWTTSIESIHPRSEIRDEQNVFIADCPLDNTNQRLRPGMKGQIKIECGDRRLYWVLSHRSVDAAQRWTGW